MKRGEAAAPVDPRPRHVARKRFGQNFLVDPTYVSRIVEAIGPTPGEHLVEIGPGLGALTAPLMSRVGHLDVVEIDRDLAASLRAAYPADRLTVHEADALDFDFATLGDRIRVVGNLPYNISSPLLFHLLRFAERLVDAHVTLQKEVVDRMVAAPETPEYGRLSVMLQVRFRIERLFTVPPGAFRPMPKVESAMARLRPLGGAAPWIADDTVFARLVALAFGQRRKTLRNALRTACDPVLLQSVGIDPARRGETLSVDEFVRLGNAVAVADSPAGVSPPAARPARVGSARGPHPRR